MVLADRRCGFVQEVFPGIRNADVNLLDFGFRFFPVVAELDLAAHAPLVAGKVLLMLLEAAQRRDERFIAHRGEAGNADIDADSGCRHRQGLLHARRPGSELGVDSVPPFSPWRLRNRRS